MNDSELINLVLDFTRQMNELEEKYYPLLQKDGSNSSDIFADYSAEVKKIYNNYLTEKNRSYYTSLGSPPKFAAVGSLILTTVEHTGNRGVITIYTRKGLVDFKFMLLYKNGRWLINSYKQKYHSDDRDINYKWTYGNF